MMSYFSLTIQTPEKEMILEKVKSLYITDELGDMQILASYIDFAGVISYSPALIELEDSEIVYLIKRAFIIFDNDENHATILAYSAQLKEEIDYKGIKEYLAFIHQKLSEGKEEDLKKYQYKFLENERVALVKQIEEMEV